MPDSQSSIQPWGLIALHHLVVLYLEPQGFGLLVKHERMRFVHPYIRLTKANFSVLVLLLALMDEASLTSLVCMSVAELLILFCVAGVLALCTQLREIALVLALVARQGARLQALDLVPDQAYLVLDIRPCLLF